MQRPLSSFSLYEHTATAREDRADVLNVTGNGPCVKEFPTFPAS